MNPDYDGPETAQGGPVFLTESGGDSASADSTDSTTGKTSDSHGGTGTNGLTTGASVDLGNATGIDTKGNLTDTGGGACQANKAPVGGVCPGVCTGGCAGNVCTIACTKATCFDTMILCPDGFACDVRCEETEACEFSTITCPEVYPCQVSCGSTSACEDTSILCGAGTCRVGCGSGGDVCKGLGVQCGGQDTVVTCEQPEAIKLGGQGMCACETVGC